MFVSAKIHQAVREELATERGKREALAENGRTLTAQISFLCHRVNQLEQERALLIRQITGVQIPVAQFTPTTPKTAAEFADAMVGSLFEDMGDDAAKQAGIGWDDQGKLKYANES